ncbi:peptidase S41 [Clostridium sp. B9]|uniref:peptidase S41 n=1 Tax=Clostridium sp. B9 TaxID=3423224 RepID=UPI003D2F1386
MKVEVSRVVASVKDAHTSMVFPARKFLPLKFYYFNDGVYIIGTTKEYENLLFKKVIGIEESSMEEVLKELFEVISFENEYFFKAQSMKYMQIAEVLYGLLIIDHMDNIKITLEDGVYEVSTCSIEELVYTNKKLPRYARNSSHNLWFEILENGELYIKYNSCREQEDISIENKIKSLIALIEENDMEKVTIDLRNNLGGNSTLFDSFIEWLKHNKKINNKGNLKVIIGRETFSSALLNAYSFKNYTNAKIVGEPSGGKPNCYGEILRITLPNSKLIITYSTRFYKLIDDDSVKALYPEETVLESIEDYKGALTK